MNDTTNTAVIDQPAAGLSRQQLDECRRLSLLVWPGISQDPFYILNAPPGYPRREGVIAAAVWGLDFQVRKTLLESGDWIGPGRQVIFFDRQLDRNSALGTTLHEIAHAVTMGVPSADHDPTPEQFERQTIQVAELLGRPIAESPGMPNWFPATRFSFPENRTSFSSSGMGRRIRDWPANDAHCWRDVRLKPRLAIPARDRR